MPLVTRLSRLLTADLHAVLDRLEEPQALLRQALREMEADVAEREREGLRLGKERERLAARVRDKAQVVQRIDGDLDLCFRADDESLARKLVRRKLEAERSIERLGHRAAAIDTALGENDRALEAKRRALDEIRGKAECLVVEDACRPADNDDGLETSSLGEDEVDAAFLREKAQRNRS